MKMENDINQGKPFILFVWLLYKMNLYKKHEAGIDSDDFLSLQPCEPEEKEKEKEKRKVSKRIRKALFLNKEYPRT